MATIEQELEEYIIGKWPKLGHPKQYSAVHEAGFVEGDEPENNETIDYLARNIELIRDRYGMGSLVMPTLQELADFYKGMGTRERARQIIDKYYNSRVPETPLPAAAAAADLLQRRSVWLESDFVEAIREAGLTRSIDHAAGLLDYLHTQGLANDYALYRPDLKKVTRATYSDHGDLVIASASRLPRLRKTFDRARRITGFNGLCRLAHIDNTRSPRDLRTIRALIQIHAQAWSTEREGEFWYTFEDRDNRLVNDSEKIFSLVKTCDIDHLAGLLRNSLSSRTSRFKEYPDEDLIREWITHSDHFVVSGRRVTFAGEMTELNGIEKDVVEIMHGRGPLASPEVAAALEKRGHGSAYIQKQIFSSALVHVDRSGGRGHYRFTLVTDLSGVSEDTGSGDPDYEAFKARLQALEKTDAPAETKGRREQEILSRWIFRDATRYNCATCRREFSVAALVTAHKKKRARCSETERRDPYIVFPLCTFGCDYLYERGFITVKEGVVVPGRESTGPTEARMIEALAGNILDARWTAGPASYFDNLPEGAMTE